MPNRRAGLESVDALRALGHEHLVGRDVPVPDAVVRARHGEGEPLLAAARGLLGELAVGDVGYRAAQARRGAALVHEPLPARAHPADLARTRDDPVVQLVAFHCPGERQLNGVQHALAVVRMERRPGEEVGPVSEPHVRRKAEHLLHARRQKDLAGREVHVPVTLVRRLHGAGVPFQRELQRLLGAIGLGHVGRPRPHLGPCAARGERSALRSMGKSGGEVPAWIVPRSSKPCRS